MANTSIKKDLTISKATTKTYELKFKENGTPTDITDWTLFFTVKTNMSDVDNSAVISKTITTHTTPTEGETEIYLSSTDTDLNPGSYYYDIKMTDNESPATVLIIATGRITIERTVTIRES